MNEINLQRLRELLLAIHGPCEKGVEFDTSKASEFGYSPEEIAFAERIISIEPDRSIIRLLKRQVIFCGLDKSFDSGIVYMVIAKIIFITAADGSKCNYIFEEELEAKVAETKDFINLLAWASTNNNDCFGNNI